MLSINVYDKEIIFYNLTSSVKQIQVMKPIFALYWKGSFNKNICLLELQINWSTCLQAIVLHTFQIKVNENCSY